MTSCSDRMRPSSSMVFAGIMTVWSHQWSDTAGFEVRPLLSKLVFFPPSLFIWIDVMKGIDCLCELCVTETAHLRNSLFCPVGSTATTYHTELSPSLSKVVNLCVENRLVLGGNMANTWGLVFPGFFIFWNFLWVKQKTLIEIWKYGGLF